VPSSDDENQPPTKKPRANRPDLAGLPDFAEEALPDMSASSTTGGELGELQPEDQLVVEVSVPESEPEPAQQPAPKDAEEGTDEE
jgi:hypothetical protein